MATTSDGTQGEHPPDPPNAHSTDDPPSPFLSAADQDISDADRSNIDDDMYFFDPSQSDPDPNPDPDPDTITRTLNKSPTFDSDKANGAIGTPSASSPTPATVNNATASTVDTAMHNHDEAEGDDTNS